MPSTYAYYSHINPTPSFASSEVIVFKSKQNNYFSNILVIINYGQNSQVGAHAQAFKCL